MPKKNRKIKKSTGEKRQLFLKEQGQDYGVITKKFGNGRYEVVINKGETKILGILRGSMTKQKRKHWVDIDSVVLVSLRDYQDNKVDIFHVYDKDEVRTLQKTYGVELASRRRTDDDDDEEDNITFDFNDI
jgi:translation initiation factor 1A